MSLKVHKGLLVAAAFTLSAVGAHTIMENEGVRYTAYPDPGGVYTICYGSTKNVRAGDVSTPEACAERLQQDSSVAGTAVHRLVTVRLSQGQYDALVDFTFNVGEGNLARSTLLKKLNAGDCYGAAAEFNRWVYQGTTVLPGLVKRRAKNTEMFIKDCHLWY